MLDTNIISDLVRNPSGRAAMRVGKVGEDRICTSIIVGAELRYGATKSGSRRLIDRIEAVLGTLDVLPFEAPADRIYGVVRASLERKGQLIGANDLLIAAHALAADCTIVTDNDAEFARVEGLRRANWLRV